MQRGGATLEVFSIGRFVKQ